jgi:hypothetical protein
LGYDWDSFELVYPLVQQLHLFEFGDPFFGEFKRDFECPIFHQRCSNLSGPEYGGGSSNDRGDANELP